MRLEINLTAATCVLVYLRVAGPEVASNNTEYHKIPKCLADLEEVLTPPFNFSHLYCEPKILSLCAAEIWSFVPPCHLMIRLWFFKHINIPKRCEVQLEEAKGMLVLNWYLRKLRNLRT